VQHFNRLAEEDKLWRQLYFTAFRMPLPSALATRKSGWRQVFASLCRTNYRKEPRITTYNHAFFAAQGLQRLVSSGDDPLERDYLEVQSAIGGIGCLGVYDEKGVLVGGTTRGKMIAINLVTGVLLRCFPAHNHTLSCIHVNQNLAVTGSWDTTLQIWNLDTYERLAKLERPGEIGYIRCCQIDKSRGFVASGSNDNTIKTWDVETGRHLDRLREHDGAVTSLKFHENNLVTGSWDKTVRLWSLREKKCVQVLGVPPSTKSDKYCSICYDPEKEVVYGGREDNQIIKFDLRAGKYECALSGHRSWVYGLTHEKRTLFSGSMDGIINIWDRETNECINSLNSIGASCVHDLAVRYGMLFVANEDASFRVMDFSDGALFF